MQQNGQMWFPQPELNNSGRRRFEGGQKGRCQKTVDELLISNRAGKDGRVPSKRGLADLEAGHGGLTLRTKKNCRSLEPPQEEGWMTSGARRGRSKEKRDDIKPLRNSRGDRNNPHTILSQRCRKDS